MKLRTSTLLLALTAPAYAQTWTTHPEKPTDWFDYTASVAEQGGDNQIFVFGGATEISVHADVYRYHPTTFWSGPLAPMPAGRDRATSATALNGAGLERIYVIGGRSAPSVANDDVWAYDPENDVWETGLAPMPTPRTDACAVNGGDGWIYVFGGIQGGTPLEKVERYHPATDVWETFPDMAFPRWRFGAARACDGFIYLFGGETGAGQTDVVEVFNPGGGFLANNQHTATPCTPMLSTRADFGTAVGRNGRIYLVGGNFLSPVGTDSVHSYNPWSNSWDVEPDLPTSRNALCAVGLGSRIWALGGYRKIHPTTAKLEAFGPLATNGACSGIVPPLPPAPWGDVSQCAAAPAVPADGPVFDVLIDGGASQWITLELADGQRLTAAMKNAVGDDFTRLTLRDQCGGQVLATSQGTGVAGEQHLDWENGFGAPLAAVLEMTWMADPADQLEFDFSLRRWYEDIGTPYCGPAVANSTGLPGVISAAGDTQVSDNDLLLSASSLPPKQFGYFIASQTQGFVQGPGGSQGNLCLGGKIARFSADLGLSGQDGVLELGVDLTLMPSSPQGPVQPGETWSFQAWYRDKNPGATSNFTNGVSVTFE